MEGIGNLSNVDANSDLVCARQVQLQGCVQGRGVRPAIYRLACAYGLTGSVANSLAGVEIVVQGIPERLEDFLIALPKSMPPGVTIDALRHEPIPVAARERFSIADTPASPVGSSSTQVPPDVRTCSACLNEVRDAQDRRHAFALNSCATCGPRYSIIHSMPFTRQETAMRAFSRCDACTEEFRDPADRRFHAETSACPGCGPRVWLSDRQGRRLDGTLAVVDRAVHAIRHGRILALRGLGGYQLLADACSEDAVQRLRQRKKRPAKPLAVMVESEQAAEQLAIVTAVEREALRSASGPIVLCRARGSNRLASSIHPGVAWLGLMLPTTALHAMLLDGFGGPLICTSGNREGEPLAVTCEQAQLQLQGIADVWLHHDRPIVHASDDSVVRDIAGRCCTLRLARGLAPLPLELPTRRPWLAVGGFMKSAIAWSDGQQAVLGPHVGDLQSEATRQRWTSHVEDTLKLYRLQPTYIARDAHPDYTSSRWAECHASRSQVVQHHHAHVVSGMLEQSWLDQRVLGVAWDGTGLGIDATIWGGEFLVATVTGFERIGHLRPFRLPGGEQAIHQPWRTALAILREVLDCGGARSNPLAGVDKRMWSAVESIVDHPQLSPETTSAGRLFDAAAAILLDWRLAAYDGQGPMLLESIADPQAAGYYPLPLRRGSPFQLDWRPLFAGLWQDHLRGLSPATLAMRFHRSLARGIVAACSQRRELPVVLSGGVFQNRLLVELIHSTMDTGQRLGLPGAIPCNDGGLAAGQLAIAAGIEENACV